jgi:Na+-transporting methylmalonyl-CoA/oxaloacetate decarboxylase gamma subunit
MEDMMLGVELLIIGMGTVVLSLYLLSVFLHFSGKFFGPKYTKNKTGSKIKTEDKIKEENTQKIKKVEKQLEDTKAVNAKKMAVISAAVYEMLSDKKNYRIISIQKSNNYWKR